MKEKGEFILFLKIRNIWLKSISTRVYFKVRFFVFTLKPYSTVSFNNIFFKLTCTRSPVSQLSGKKTELFYLHWTIFCIFLSAKSQKRPYAVKILLKIKILLSRITCKRVEILQKFQRFWVCLILSFKQLKFETIGWKVKSHC